MDRRRLPSLEREEAPRGISSFEQSRIDSTQFAIPFVFGKGNKKLRIYNDYGLLRSNTLHDNVKATGSKLIRHSLNDHNRKGTTIQRFQPYRLYVFRGKCMKQLSLNVLSLSG